MNVYIPYTRLPSAYQEVEYIQSSGSQYIDTGIANVSINTRLEYSYTPMANNNGLVFMDNGWNSNGIGNGWTYYYYGSYNSSWSFSSNVIGTKYDFVISNTECSRNGADKIVPGLSSLNPIGTVLLFVNRRNGSVDTGYFSSSKCHYYRRYDNGTLVQELVPCYRKSDGVIGMYDIVNGVFYTNQGTGTFSKGNDVNMSVLKNIYIGEYKVYSVDFTTATAASLQADGFTTYGNLGLDSNGMYVGSGDNAECGVYKAVDLTGCSKFTLKFYSSLTSGSWAGGPNLGIGALSGSSFTSPYSWLNFRSNNNSGYCGEQLFYENTIIAQNTTAKSNGDYTTTIVYDFSNSTVSVTTTGPTPASYSASLSSAQVSALTQNRYVKYGIGVGGWNAGRYNRLKKVERIIE